MLCSVEDNKPQNRINDAKCDSSGRVWFGTSARQPVFGEESGAALYCYAKGCVIYLFVSLIQFNYLFVYLLYSIIKEVSSCPLI